MPSIAQAAAFLSRQFGLEGMRLQKMLYYAQAAALVERGQGLFPEDFQAWRYGPVNREVWEGQLDHAPLASDDEALLRATCEQYGHLSTYQLSDLSHIDGPWQHARAGLSEDMGSDRVIHKKLMENFYLGRKLVQRTDGAWEHTAPTEEEWRAAKLALILKRQQRGRFKGEDRVRFLREQVMATQRLEGITVHLPVTHG